MKKYIAFVNQHPDFIKESASFMKSVSAISGILSEGSVLHDILPEIFKKHLKADSFATNEKFAAPIQITEHDVRAFYSKIGKGIFAAGHFVGATLNTPQELYEFFDKKVGAKAFGSDWLFSSLLERMMFANKGVYLLLEVSNEKLKNLKEVYKNDLAIVQVIDPEGEEVLELTDVTIELRPSPEETQKETATLLNTLKEKWKHK